MRNLGTVGDRNTENEVLLLEHDIPHHKWSEAVLDCLPKLPWVITEEVGTVYCGVFQCALEFTSDGLGVKGLYTAATVLPGQTHPALPPPPTHTFSVPPAEHGNKLLG